MRRVLSIDRRHAAALVALVIALVPVIAHGEQPDESKPGKVTWLKVRGVAYLQQCQASKAIEDFTAAISLQPNDPDLYFLRAMTLNVNGDYQEAVDDYSKILELDATRTLMYVHRGMLQSKLGKYEQALADFDAALEKSPQLANAYHAKAMLLAACPDEKFRNGDDAIDSATRGCELKKYNWSYLSVLAAAYAEHGDWPLAIEMQTKALGLANEVSQRTQCSERLKLFEAKQPCRQTKELIERERLAHLSRPQPIRFQFKERQESDVQRR